jgi:hypothetical protein
MEPVLANDTQKPMETLQACLDELNTAGAVGTLRWPDGFTISLGTVVYVAMTPIAGTKHFAVVYAVQHFEEGGEHHSGYHVHRIVNWSAEDPPLEFAVIDDEGRTLEFWLLEPSCQPEEAQAYAAWREKMAQQPEVRDAAFARMHEALANMAREWPEDD